MKKNTLTLIFKLLIVMICVLPAGPAVLAQSDAELKLGLSRDFGYASLNGSEIQGTFSMHVSGPDDLVRVVFYLDDQILGEDSEAPFSLRFVTDNYSLGVHTLHARGVTAAGSELRSNVIRTEFVEAGRGMGMAARIIGITFGVIFAGMAIAFLFSNVLGKGKKTDLPLGAPRRYGAMGGTICPRCSRPFAVHIFSLNLMAARFDRCPYCGKWSFIRRASPATLKAAEEAELEWASPEPRAAREKTQADLRKDLDDSRFQDL